MGYGGGHPRGESKIPGFFLTSARAAVSKIQKAPAHSESWMEQRHQEKGCESVEDIREAVAEVWEAVEPRHLASFADMVRGNMASVVERSGGNFYHEGTKRVRR